MSQVNAAGRELLARVRAGFIIKGTTLAQWCRSQGIHPSAARQAIYGTWGGPKGRAVRERILAAAGVSGGSQRAAA